LGLWFGTGLLFRKFLLLNLFNPFFCVGTTFLEKENPFYCLTLQNFWWVFLTIIPILNKKLPKLCEDFTASQGSADAGLR